MKTKPATRSSLCPRFRILFGKDIALGPGKAELLALVEKTGSINEAARRMNMSYMRAWLLIRTMNHCFKEPLVVAARGGQRGGGANLTEAGGKALALYQQMENMSLRAIGVPWRQLRKLLRGSTGQPSAGLRRKPGSYRRSGVRYI